MAEMKALKNPLNQAFGIVLRKAREKRSWSYDYIETLSGIKPSYFKMVEQGQFNLHVSKAYTLYNTFKNEFIDHLFSLEGFIQILCLISIVETYANEKIREKEKSLSTGKSLSLDEKNRVYASGLFDASLRLSSEDQKINSLFKKFFETNIFKMNSSDQVSNCIEENGLDKEVEDFIINYASFGLELQERQTLYFSNFFNDLTSMYVDFINETKKNLSNLPVRIFFTDLWKWEQQNSERFEELYVFITDKFDVSQQREKYLYWYLWAPKFKVANFLILGNNKISPKTIKNTFEKNLAKSYEKASERLPSHWRSGLNKIHFKTVSEFNGELKKVLQSIESTQNYYEVFWVFKYADNNVVAFVANAKEDITKKGVYYFEEGKSLNVLEAINRYNILVKEYAKY